MATAGSPVTLDEFCSELGYTDSSGFYDFTGEPQNLPTTVANLNSKLDVDAVYGQHQGETSRFRPVVYFKEYSDSKPDNINQIYNNVWNEGRATLLVVVMETRVKIYNCTREPVDAEEDVDSAERLFEELDLYQKSLEEISSIDSYNRANIASRNFWKENHDHFDRGDRVDRHLLSNLKTLKNKLTEDISLEYANNLIIRSVFLLYLEDREIITKSFYQQRLGRDGYRTILDDKETTYGLFDIIEDELNGDIFQYEDEEYETVDETHLRAVQAFLNGTDVETGQTRLFPYRFDLIPIELVSSIYEHFVGGSGEDGTFYTRPEVVDYIFEEVLSKPVHKYDTILDPTCGSGVFLVSAFSRLVEHEQRQDRQITIQRLKELLSERLYGVDNNSEAVRITTFSLSLKLIEYLEEPDVWQEEFELPSLIGNSIQQHDFFDFDGGESFDLVVGNPPWGSLNGLGSNAKEYLTQNERTIGGNEASQAFMWKALNSLSKEGESCLAVPIRKVLLYEESGRAFREHFFRDAKVNTVVNLSPMDDMLFENARNPAAIISFERNQAGEQDGVKYVTPKSFDVDILRSIPIDSDYDVKYLTSDELSFKSIWKTASWGGIADINLMQKLASVKNLDEIIQENNWKIGTGFEAGSTTYKMTHSPELSALPYLNTRKLESYFVPDDELEKLDREDFKHPRDLEQYQPPLVTIRASATQRTSEPGAVRGVKAALHNKAVSYRSGVVGISGQSDDSDILRLITLALNSSITQYWLFMSASGWGVGRNNLRQSEIRSIPLPIERLRENKSRLLDLAGTLESIISEEGRGEQYRKCVRELDQVLYDVYDLTESERRLIESRVNVLIEYYHSKYESKAVSAVSRDELIEYGEILCQEINRYLEFSEYSLYPIIYRDSVRRSPLELVTLQLKPDDAAHVSAADSSSENIGMKLKEIDQAGTASSIYYKRVAQLFFDDHIHLIKPNELRFWSVGEAINDAPELVGELLD